jgi:polyisoprenoid-binding protein YceI
MIKALIIAAALTNGHAIIAKTVTGTADWTAVGNPGFLRITGEGGTVTGEATEAGGKVSGTFKVKLADYTTGMGLRDSHMKDKYLEVAKYPEAVLVLDPVIAGPSFVWGGKLTLKGVTKPVTGKASYTGGKLKAFFTVNIKDFPSIGVPSHLGVTVANTVDVEVMADVK